MAMVLSYSRKKYVEWFKDPIDTAQFIHFHQRAFEALGGICNQIVYDQTKLAVIEERYGEIEFNEEFYRFAYQLGFEPYICHKYDPESKERGDKKKHAIHTKVLLNYGKKKNSILSHFLSLLMNQDPVIKKGR